MHRLDVGAAVKPLCGILASTAQATFTTITPTARAGTEDCPYAENSDLAGTPTVTEQRDSA